MDVIVALDIDWPRLGPPLGTAEPAQFRGPSNSTAIFTFVASSPLQTTVLLRSMRTSPVSSTIVRLIDVGSDVSPGSQVFPGASTPWTISTTFLTSVDPFPPVATFRSETWFGWMLST